MSTTPTSTSYAVHGPVAVVTLNNPPVNSLGHALRSGIVEEPGWRSPDRL